MDDNGDEGDDDDVDALLDPGPLPVVCGKPDVPETDGIGVVVLAGGPTGVVCPGAGPGCVLSTSTAVAAPTAATVPIAKTDIRNENRRPCDDGRIAATRRARSAEGWMSSARVAKCARSCSPYSP